MIDTFLFDFDGTVADSIPGILVTLEKTRAAMGCDYSIDYAKSLIGTPLVMMGAKLCGNDRTSEFVETYRKEYKAWAADLIRYYDGIEEILQFLKDKKMTVAIVTSKRKDSLLLNLEHLNSDNYFDLLVTKESTDFFKPNPAPCEYALSGLNASPKQAVMVGDTHYDIECAKGAGVITIGVTWGAESAEELKHAKPTYIVNTTTELRELLETIIEDK
jgi:pyrophosphatase PpaX